MGVPRLDRYVRMNYKQHVRFFHPKDKTKYIRPDVTCVDSNPLIHKAAQVVFNYGSYKRRVSTYDKYTYEQKVNQVYILFFQYLKEVVNIAMPNKTLYIAIDGVAPLAKQVQQRQRRFRSAVSESEFDSCCISAGTLFMHNLSKYVNYHIRKEMQFGDWSKFQVIYSSHTVPGEGEHTIMDYLRDLRRDNVPIKDVCMYGPDGDLLMLGLVSPFKFHLLKEDMYKNDTWYFVECTPIRQTITRDLGLSANREYDAKTVTRRGIQDFILLGFLLGNDFLPKMQMFHLLEDGIELFIKTYKQFIAPSKKFLTCKGKIDRENFRYFLSLVQRRETDYLVEQTNVKVPDKKFRNQTLERHVTRTHTTNRETKKCLDFSAYRQDYYKTKLGSADVDTIRRMVFAYLDGLKWILHYYLYGCPSVDWVYPFHYPPFVMDVLEYLDDWPEPTFVKTDPHLPFEQLIGVLPPSSFSLLPSPYTSLLHLPALKEFFNTDIEIDFEGKRQDYQGVTLTPMIDFSLIRDYYKSIKTQYVYARNTPSTDRTFRVGGQTHTYTSEYGSIKQCTIHVS